MDDINGMELAKKIREGDKNVLLVFVTLERGFVMMKSIRARKHSIRARF